ncbi:MAG: hypothetical protein ACI4PE_02730 [Bacilli bacterium]
MINITGNQIFNIFIMQSEVNKQKVLNYTKRNFTLELDEILNILNLRKSDFTDYDYQELIEKLVQ